LSYEFLKNLPRFTEINPYVSTMIITTLVFIIFFSPLLGLVHAHRFIDVILSFVEKGCKISSEHPQYVGQAIIALGLCCDVNKYLIDYKATVGSRVFILIILILSVAKPINNLMNTSQISSMTAEDVISALVSIFLYSVTFALTAMYYAFAAFALVLIMLKRMLGKLGAISTLTAGFIVKEIYYDIAIPIAVLILKAMPEGGSLEFITAYLDALVSLPLAAVAYYFKVFVEHIIKVMVMTALLPTTHKCF